MNYSDERFADLQLLRYRLNGFEQLSLSQKILVYYLSKATLFGRDITFDQFGKYNLRIRKVLETVYTDLRIPHDTDEFRALEVYLKRLWFSNGIYHHYGCEKFIPAFTADYLRSNDNNIYADMRARSSDGTIYMTIPIISGNKLLTQWFTSSSVTVTTARFIPCQGNI